MSSPSKLELRAAPPEPATETERPSCAADDALHAIVAREYAAVWRFLRRLGVRELDADDTAQRVFARVLAKRGEVQPGAERAYLMRAAFRAALEDQRSRQRARDRSADVELDIVHSPSPQPDEAFAQRQQLELLDHALAALPTDLRAVLMLFEIEGLSFSEIALALELPRGTVASRVRRARALFAEAVRRDRLRSAL